MSGGAGPRFIVLEGGEGAGKSLLAARLERRFERAGVPALTVREPGSTPAGERVRELLARPLSPWAEAFAFLLARAELVHGVIRPALEAGTTVLCDRFSPSTIAYQGHGRGLDAGRLAEACEWAADGLAPDLVVYLDAPPATGLRRKLPESVPADQRPLLDVPPDTDARRGAAEGAGPATGREPLAFHERVREGYRAQLAATPPGAWLEIDATQPADAVEAAAWGEIARRRGLPAEA